MERNSLNIVILGAGNVATFLAEKLNPVANIVQVWSRSATTAKHLASKLTNAEVIESPSKVDTSADFYIIAVADDAIEEVASQLPEVNGIVAHTSGSFPLDRFMKIVKGRSAGVLYPLQTFTKKSKSTIKDVPFLIEGSSGDTSSKLVALARMISDDVLAVGSAMRADLHLAAVFANNFTNYILDLANRYLKENTKFSIKVLQPLLIETINKAMSIDPYDAQTGPAVRNDVKVIDSHLKKLSPELAEVYNYLTERIKNDHHNF